MNSPASSPWSSTTGTTSTTDASSDKDCTWNPTCDSLGFLVIVCAIVLFVYVILALAKLLLCCLYKRRSPRSDQSERTVTQPNIDELGHPFSYLAEQGFDNCAFTAPPPSYDQLFKADEPPPVYDTAVSRTSQTQGPSRSAAPSFTSTASNPVVISVQGNSLPTGAFGTSVLPPNTVQVETHDIRLRSETTVTTNNEEEPSSNV